VVAHDLTPSDTAQLNKKFVKGFVTDIGGRTAHSAIMARSLELPAVVGTDSITKDVENGDTIAVDGLSGDVVVKPTDSQVAEYQQKSSDFLQAKS